MKRKKRIYQGKLRNVEEKKKIIKKAVSKIMLTKGFSSLGVNKISVEAGVSKTLLYRYFGSFKNLLEQYGEDTDFWISHLKTEELSKLPEAEALKVIIEQQFNYLSTNPEMQRLVLWELFESNYNTATLLKKREEFGEQILLQRTDKLFGTKQDFRAIAAILVAATYHLATYSSIQKVPFCGIDLADEAGKKRIMEAMYAIVTSTFASCKKKKK